MLAARITQLLGVSLLLILPSGCAGTKSSLRSDLERQDVRNAERLSAKRQQSPRALPRAPQKPAQAATGLSQKVYRRSEWKARSHNAKKLDVVGGTWEKITVHHSDEVGTLVFNGSFSESAQAVRSIQRHHLDGNGWGDIGYHYLIDARGRIFEGREIRWQGAHAGDSRKNRRNLGVCLLGDFNHGVPTAESRVALRGLLDDLREVHRLPRSKVYLHSDLSNTECPGRHLSAWVRSYRGS
ncbi:MAG: peptidoglycan recognition protein family protein [Planctomycetes bacterium]|nr:peptidoglycan recognition protein family protein [Planctomycetota bacterium]